MATCPQCYTGTCKRHERQDHGRSLVKSANAESTLQKMYDQLVGSKLQKLQAEAERDPSGQHTKDFRKKLDASRAKSLRKAHKSRVKGAATDVTGSGLNPQALAAIYADDSDEDSSRKKPKRHARKRKHRRSEESSSSEESDDSHRRHKRSRKHKKSHKKHKRSRTDE